MTEQTVSRPPEAHVVYMDGRNPIALLDTLPMSYRKPGLFRKASLERYGQHRAPRSGEHVGLLAVTLYRNCNLRGDEALLLDRVVQTFDMDAFASNVVSHMTRRFPVSEHFSVYHGGPAWVLDVPDVGPNRVVAAVLLPLSVALTETWEGYLEKGAAHRAKLKAAEDAKEAERAISAAVKTRFDSWANRNHLPTRSRYGYRNGPDTVGYLHRDALAALLDAAGVSQATSAPEQAGAEQEEMPVPPNRVSSETPTPEVGDPQ